LHESDARGLTGLIPSLPMPRLASLGSVLALVGLAALACNKPDKDGRSIGSPSADGAGTETASPRPTDKSTSSGAANLARTLVAVASAAPSEALPCERTCGRVGDCLLETRDVGEFDAGRLEFECLDLCVHSPREAESRTAFLACEQQSSCGELLGCARANWQPLLAGRTGPVVSGVTVGGDPCIEGCRWLFACMVTGVPPGQASLPPEYDESVRGCEAACHTGSESDRQMLAHYAECLPSHCGGYEVMAPCMQPYY
jgi:hypothetical protein